VLLWNATSDTAGGAAMLRVVAGHSETGSQTSTLMVRLFDPSSRLVVVERKELACAR
jgi:hypothetical protein